MSCPLSGACEFYETASASLMARIKYASAFPYCRGGKDADCAIAIEIRAHRPVPEGLLPTGEREFAMPAEFETGASVSTTRRIVVIDDSPIFVRLAVAAVQNACPGYEVMPASSYEEASHLLDETPALVVTGYGVGGGRTVHDVVARLGNGTPVVVFTGKPDVDLPFGATLVEKTAGATALADAARMCLQC